MKRIFTYFLIFSFCSGFASDRKVRALYNTLDPRSIPQHLAFYEIYPNTREGQMALQVAWKLLSKGNPHTTDGSFDGIPIPTSAVNTIVDLVNKQPNETIPVLKDREIAIIDRLGSPLPNRLLKGHIATSENEVLALPPNEIDIARGVFLSQFGSDTEAHKKIRSYEAMIDLMALQVLTRISLHASPKEKVRAINDFIFIEMGFRFPPHSLYAKDVDIYTFLPSVLDSRHGVCLGVSILYLSLAQRLDLPLEAITPCWTDL